MFAQDHRPPPVSGFINMSKQKIVSIEIELKDYEPIKFTMAEAKELYEQLHSLFGEKEKHIHHYRPWWERPYYNWNTSSGTIKCQNLENGNIYDALMNTTVASSATNMKVTYNA